MEHNGQIGKWKLQCAKNTLLLAVGMGPLFDCCVCLSYRIASQVSEVGKT